MSSKCSCKCADWGLLLIRVALAVVFLSHGIQKLGHMDGVVMFFSSLGMPAFFAWLVAIVETLGGAAMLLGVFVQFVGPALAIIMLVAILKAKTGHGLAGFEFELALLLASLGIAATGPGKLAVLKHVCVCQRGKKDEKEGCCGGGCCSDK